jgi:hypothetical protein
LRGAAFGFALPLAAVTRRRAGNLRDDREVFRAARLTGAARFALRSFVPIGCPFA